MKASWNDLMAALRIANHAYAAGVCVQSLPRARDGYFEALRSGALEESYAEGCVTCKMRRPSQ